MPFYPNLRSDAADDAALANKKNRVINNLKRLRADIRSHINQSRSNNNNHKTAKIATWNIREFGKSNYKGRTFEELYYIAEIISHFDLVAVQEVKADLDELDEVKRYLGPSWSYIATDVTDGSAGNGERMVFLYNRNVFYFKDVAGELTLGEGSKITSYIGERIKLENSISLTIPNGVDFSGEYSARTRTKDNGDIVLKNDLEIPLKNVGECTLKIPDDSFLVLKRGTIIERPRNGVAKVTVPTNSISGDDFGLRLPPESLDDAFKQFARTPFLISFQTGWLKIHLCTVHIYYGEKDEGPKMDYRRREIEELTKALADKAKDEYSYDKESFMCVLGDFNIVSPEHHTMQALESNGFEIPDELKRLPGTNVAKDKYYDQIAFHKPGRTTGYSKLEVVGSGVFDFFETIYRSTDTVSDEQEYRNDPFDFTGLKTTSKFETWRTYKMSDHLPMWIEVQTDFGDRYLDAIS